MTYRQQLQPSFSTSQRHRPRSQQKFASREAFLWHRKLEVKEQTFDTIAHINALQDKLALLERQKRKLKQELLDVQTRLLSPSAIVALFVRRPQPDLHLMETQIKRLLEEEGKTRADLLFARHTLESLHAKVAHLELELSLL